MGYPADSKCTVMFAYIPDPFHFLVIYLPHSVQDSSTELLNDWFSSQIYYDVIFI